MIITNSEEPTMLTAVVELFDGAEKVVIASGYVTKDGCARLDLVQRAKDLPIHLVVGRAMIEGLHPATKAYFKYAAPKLKSSGGGIRIHQGGFHSKIYAAKLSDDRAKSIVGSSNLTPPGLAGQIEANVLLSDGDAYKAAEEAERLYLGAVDFLDVVDGIPTCEPKVKKLDRAGKDKIVIEQATESDSTLGLTISLLDSHGQVPQKSGINWFNGLGRPRDRYECYIRLPRAALEAADVVFGSNSRGTICYGVTHDGQTMELLLQGRQGPEGRLAKQISTHGSNRELGRWIIGDCLHTHEMRLITVDDLSRYGRTDISFYRIGTAEDGRAIVYIDFLPPG